MGKVMLNRLELLLLMQGMDKLKLLVRNLALRSALSHTTGRWQANLAHGDALRHSRQHEYGIRTISGRVQRGFDSSKHRWSRA